MNQSSDATQLLDHWLPKTFDLPCNREGRVNFEFVELGLLSLRDWGDVGIDQLSSGSRLAFQQIAGINPLQTLVDWGELREHYFILRTEAVAGCEDAMNDLGWLWLNVEMPAMRTLATQVLRLAASKGSCEALYNLGEQYLEGRGVTADLAQAMDYFQKASSDLTEASLRLGILYEYGRDDFPGFEADATEAIKWYRVARSDGNCWGGYYVSKLLLEDSPPDGEVALAIHELQELAMSGTLISTEASERLAMYYVSQGLGIDYQPLYVFWRDYAAAQGSAWAEELKEQEDAPAKHPVSKKTTVRLTLVPGHAHAKK
jgi:TPR repeat protein